MKPEERLAKIRSIIRDAEKAMDSPWCDQLPLLRQAILEISIAAGPQMSGKSKRRKEDDEAG